MESFFYNTYTKVLGLIIVLEMHSTGFVYMSLNTSVPVCNPTSLIVMFPSVSMSAFLA